MNLYQNAKFLIHPATSKDLCQYAKKKNPANSNFNLSDFKNTVIWLAQIFFDSSHPKIFNSYCYFQGFVSAYKKSS